MNLAEWIMRLAALVAPQRRTSWTTAMAAEFASLTAGRLGWSLGCLATACRWRLKSEAWFCVAVVGAIAGTEYGVEPLYSQISMTWLPHAPLTGLLRIAFYVMAWLPFLFTVMLLGFWRPDRVKTTAAMVFGFHMVAAYLFFHFVMHARFGYIHFMDLPPVVGEAAVMGYSLGGASIGAALRRAVAPMRQPA